MAIGILNSSYEFSASRMERILKANNLNDAQQMGLWDSIKDFFQGGVKRQAIKQLFTDIQIHNSSGEQPPEATIAQLNRFHALRDAAKPEHQNKFTVLTGTNEATEAWTYAFIIDGKLIAGGTLNKDDSKLVLNQFNEYRHGQMSTDDHTRTSHKENNQPNNMFTQSGTSSSKIPPPPAPPKEATATPKEAKTPTTKQNGQKGISLADLLNGRKDLKSPKNIAKNPDEEVTKDTNMPRFSKDDIVNSLSNLSAPKPSTKTETDQPKVMSEFDQKMAERRQATDKNTADTEST